MRGSRSEELRSSSSYSSHYTYHLRNSTIYIVLITIMVLQGEEAMEEGEKEDEPKKDPTHYSQLDPKSMKVGGFK